MASNDRSDASFERTISTGLFSPAAALVSLTAAHHFVSIKLTFRNYLYWRTQMVPFIRGQGLLGYVDDTNVCPPPLVAVSADGASSAANLADVDTPAVPPVANPAALAWIQQDQAILSMVVASFSDEVMYIALGLSTSRMLSKAIENALGSDTWIA